MLLLVVTAVAVYALDQVTKALAVAHLDPARPVEVLGPLLRLQLVYNPGAAFGIATSMTWVFTVIATVVVVAVVRYARRLSSLGWGVALGLVLAGAAGNLTDRLAREPGFARGHVVDFLELPHWPVFNVADSAICTAAVLVAVLALRGIDVDGRRTGEGDGAGEGTGEGAALTPPVGEPRA